MRLLTRDSIRCNGVLIGTAAAFMCSRHPGGCSYEACLWGMDVRGDNCVKLCSMSFPGDGCPHTWWRK